MGSQIKYLNTDLDLTSAEDLTALAAAFEAQGVFPLHVARGDDGLWYATLEYDGGTVGADTIARLSRFVPIDFSGNNLVDAALAEGEFHHLDRAIYWIGQVRGIRSRAAVGPGLLLEETGRTTNYTTGRVVAIRASVNVNYGGGRVARFVDQIVTTAMSAGGDSGSLVLDLSENATGLLFAGSASHTIVNYIEHVQNLLQIVLD